jgi:N-acetylmuramoyl-L-alanine amidase
MDAAGRVLGQLDDVGVIRKSAVQQAGFLVLKSPDIPSMLVETAYISNPGEERNLRSSSHQQKVAEAIFSGIQDFFRVSPPDGTLFAEQRHAARSEPTIVADSVGP